MACSIAARSVLIERFAEFSLVDCSWLGGLRLGVSSPEPTQPDDHAFPWCEKASGS